MICTGTVTECVQTPNQRTSQKFGLTPDGTLNPSHHGLVTQIPMSYQVVTTIPWWRPLKVNPSFIDGPTKNQNSGL